MEYISCADTAKLVRQALKEAFPGVKFSVRSSTYAGGASINVRWADGPTAAMVETIASTFSGSYFDGSTDYKGSTYALIDGKQVRFGADFIFCNRDTSRALLERVMARGVRKWGAEFFDGLAIKDSVSGDAYFAGVYGEAQRELNSLAARLSLYLAPRKSKTAGRVIYLGNDGYSERGALQVAA